VSVAARSSVDDRVLEIDQGSNRIRRVGLVDQQRTAAEELAMVLKDEVDRRLEEWVAGADELGEWEPDDRDPVLLERDPFVCAETPGRSRPP